jgi:hypothetical protein
MPLTELSLAGKILIIPGQGEFGKDGKTANLLKVWGGAGVAMDNILQS